MKKLVKSIVLLSAVVTAGGASATALEGLCPFIGVDYKESYMRGKGSEFNSLLKKHYHGANIYAGARFHDNASLEVGYDWERNSRRAKVFANNTTFFGQNATGLTTNAKARVTGAHLDLNGHLPVANGVELLGSVGVGFWKPRLSIGNNTVNASTQNVLSFKSEGKRRGVARLRAGVQYMFNTLVGVRALVGWDNTSHLRLKSHPSDVNSAVNKPFKDQTSASVGAFLSF